MNQQLVTLLPLVLLIVIMYFLLIRPQKKREKSVAAMRNSIKVGDEVITIGGICGKIVKTKDETLTIQVGADKTKFEIMRWAVSKVVTDEPASSSKKTKREEPEEDNQKEAQKKTLPKRMGKKADKAPQGEVPAEEAAVTEAEAVEETDNKE
ncbi:MAG TPA: preprotein translocase subunit YajC [Anaerovoracaceae bacterium]|nr:preprotein translocase subunit YajC [Anaerovoracaceae bacterium]